MPIEGTENEDENDILKTMDDPEDERGMQRRFDAYQKRKLKNKKQWEKNTIKGYKLARKRYIESQGYIEFVLRLGYDKIKQIKNSYTNEEHIDNVKKNIIVLRKIGEASMILGELENAIKICKSALIKEDYEEYLPKNLFFRVYWVIARSHRLLGNIQKAKEYIEKGLECKSTSTILKKEKEQILLCEDNKNFEMVEYLEISPDNPLDDDTDSDEDLNVTIKRYQRTQPTHEEPAQDTQIDTQDNNDINEEKLNLIEIKDTEDLWSSNYLFEIKTKYPKKKKKISFEMSKTVTIKKLIKKFNTKMKKKIKCIRVYFDGYVVPGKVEFDELLNKTDEENYITVEIQLFGEVEIYKYKIQDFSQF